MLLAVLVAPFVFKCQHCIGQTSDPWHLLQNFKGKNTDQKKNPLHVTFKTLLAKENYYNNSNYSNKIPVENLVFSITVSFTVTSPPAISMVRFSSSPTLWRCQLCWGAAAEMWRMKNMKNFSDHSSRKDSSIALQTAAGNSGMGTGAGGQKSHPLLPKAMNFSLGWTDCQNPWSSRTWGCEKQRGNVKGSVDERQDRALRPSRIHLASPVSPRSII